DGQQELYILTNLADVWAPLHTNVSGLKSLAGSFYLDVFAEGCENFIRNQTLQALLKDQKFDVAIFHMVAMCEFGLTHLLDIKSIIWMSSGLLYDNQAWTQNIPVPYSHIPQLLSHFDDKMTFRQRLFNIVRYLTFHYTDAMFNNGLQTKVYRKIYGPSFPDLLNDIAPRSKWIWTNNDLFLDFARPIVDRLTYIAGVGMPDVAAKKHSLNAQWREALDEAVDGVVLFSLGSITNTDGMPLEWKTSFLNAFSRFPTYTFIWKLDSKIEDSSITIPQNVIVTQWMPQNDLLASTRVKGFITHGGFNSLMEATMAGIPLIMIPLFWDQFRNANNAVSRGVGIMLTKRQIVDPERLYTVLRDMLYNKRMRTCLLLTPPLFQDS
uniref:glucuronosyltransferase n=1 Tax=Romanomermis culicivorax TaxID=13658 RepID=A0A915HK44_ROMCU